MKKIGSIIAEHKKPVTLIVIAVIILCMIKLTNRYNSSFYREILESSAFAKGYFTGEVEIGGKGSNGSQYTCQYYVGYKAFTSHQPVFRCRPLGRSLFEHSFPVIYNTNKPSQSEVLVFPSDFAEFDLPFPDSLRWVLEYDRRRHPRGSPK